MDNGYTRMQAVIINQILGTEQELIKLKEQNENYMAYCDIREEVDRQSMSKNAFKELFQGFLSSDFDLTLLMIKISALENRLEYFENIKGLIDSRIEQVDKN